VVLAHPAAIPANYLWYLSTRPGSVAYQPSVLAGTESSMSILTFAPDASLIDSIQRRLHAQGMSLTLIDDREYRLQIGPEVSGPSYCRSTWWTTARPVADSSLGVAFSDLPLQTSRYPLVTSLVPSP
jgi:hypothetical protein